MDLSIAALRRHTRAKRHRLFRDYVDRLPRPLRVIDLGGTAASWRDRISSDEGLDITLVNNHHIDKSNEGYDNSIGFITELRADVGELTADDLAGFDLVYSNSFLEHLESRDRQRAVAATVEASGRPFFLQVPNKNCPIDPHYPGPALFAARYPKPVLAWLLTRSGLGSGTREPDIEAANRRLRYYTPIGYRDLARLFPGATITREWTFGFNPSLIATRPLETLAT
jgi:hypothetical protein